MDTRMERVLTYVIEDYIKTADPISSQSLIEQHALNVSSATVRNWFATLEMEGMLYQPHTSSGRIPSERAFQWYADQLPPPKGQKELIDTIRSVPREEEYACYVKRIARTCVDMTGTAALVGTGESDTYYTGLTGLFMQPEFQDWSRVISMSAILDSLDAQLHALRQQTFSEPTVLLGERCPFGNACGSVLLTLSDHSLLAFLGPIRMNYKRIKNIMCAVSSLK